MNPHPVIQEHDLDAARGLALGCALYAPFWIAVIIIVARVIFK